MRRGIPDDNVKSEATGVGDTAGVTADVRKALGAWAEEEGCRLLVVFGSAAEDRASATSDLDLAVQFDTLPGPGARLRMIGELQDRCAGRPVDVVFLRPATDPVLRFEVFRSGEPVYERRPGVFIEERVRAVKLHEDALPFRRALRRRLTPGSGS